MTAGDSRRQARILAMQALYEADVAHHEPRLVLARLLGAEAYPGAVASFAERLVGGVADHLGQIDPLIAQAAPTWPLAQMAKIDKSILRIAAYEVLLEPEVPYKAAINEAVEIAKLFGSDSSSRFVNGVLGTIAGWQAGDRQASAADPAAASPLADDER